MTELARTSVAPTNEPEIDRNPWQDPPNPAAALWQIIRRFYTVPAVSDNGPGYYQTDTRACVSQEKQPAVQELGEPSAASLWTLGSAIKEITRLRPDCAEAYQAVGFLADCLGYSADDPRQVQLTKLLDNLSAASDGRPRPHADLLPFGWQA